LPHLEGLKEPILDVSCRDHRNIEYIVEMQVFYTSAFDKRILYYTSKKYVEQLERGEDFPHLNQVIFIGILDFLLFKEIEDYKSIHKIMELKTREIFFKDFVFILIELPKFELELNELKSIEEKWFYFIKNAGNLEVEPEILSRELAIHEALSLAERVKWSKEEFDLYIKRGIYIQDERGRITESERKGRENGFLEGKIEGKKEGKLETATIMLEHGLPVEEIAKYTGLSIDEIKRLK
jgi:predicted transposase/invertase (TIGR01784 family)